MSLSIASCLRVRPTVGKSPVSSLVSLVSANRYTPALSDMPFMIGGFWVHHRSGLGQVGEPVRGGTDMSPKSNWMHAGSTSYT